MQRVLALVAIALTALTFGGGLLGAGWLLALGEFDTVIPQIKDVQHSEADFSPGGGTGRLEALFTQLSVDVERELPSECRRTSKASS